MKNVLYWLSVVLLLVACVPAAPDSLPSEAQALPAATNLPTEVAPVATVTPSPATTAEEEGLNPVDRLRVDVAESLGLAPESLVLVSSESATWRNSALGCPKPGTDYLQVLVEGWRVVFRDETGQEYQIHTAENFQRFVICEETEVDSEKDLIDESSQDVAVEAAVALFEENLEIDREQITVVSAESVQWSNSCLGCAAPDQVCLMMITPGYRVLLEVDGETYEVHTDGSGKQALVCSDNVEAPPLDMRK